jgi:hypothetical protein
VALTEQDWVYRVTAELGLPLTGAPAPVNDQTAQALQALSNYVPTLWAMSAANANNVFLRYLYTKLAAIDVLLGALRDKTDAMLGRALRVSGSQRFKQLLELRKATADEVAKWGTFVASIRSPAFGLLAHKAPLVAWETPPAPGPGQPVPPPPWLPDPNNWQRYDAEGVAPAYPPLAPPTPPVPPS